MGDVPLFELHNELANRPVGQQNDPELLVGVVFEALG